MVGSVQTTLIEARSVTELGRHTVMETRRQVMQGTCTTCGTAISRPVSQVQDIVELSQPA